jgi:hypothetical protein
MHLDFELCDLEQTVLTRLDQRKPGGWVQLGLNAMRRGFCPLSLDDGARELAEAVKSVLRITLKDDDLPDGSLPLFIGRVIIPEDKADAKTQELGLNASDPLFQLERKLARSAVGAVWNPVAFAATDQGQVMWSLISALVGHGVTKGSVPPSINRDRTYPPGKEVGQALIEMSQVIGGPDFELEPTLATDGTLALFNTYYPRQGADKSEDVVFTFRNAPEDAIAFSHAPGGEEICNRFIAVGAPADEEGEEESPVALHPAYLVEHAGSIAEYKNAFEEREQLDDVKELATLKAHAEAVVAARAFPTPYFSFTAAPEQYAGETGEGVPPRFGIDYWLGDTIGCNVYYEGSDEPLELTGRATDAKVIERPSGQLDVELSCAPEISSVGLSGEALTWTVPEGE